MVKGLWGSNNPVLHDRISGLFDGVKALNSTPLIVVVENGYFDSR